MRKTIKCPGAVANVMRPVVMSTDQSEAYGAPFGAMLTEPAPRRKAAGTRGHAQTHFDPEAVDARIRGTLERNRVPGAAVIVDVDGEVTFLPTYGQDGRGDPVTDQTAFRLGSMGKAFTVLVALRLVERGVIALQTPVTSVLPNLTMFQDSGGSRDLLASIKVRLAELDCF